MENFWIYSRFGRVRCRFFCLVLFVFTVVIVSSAVGEFVAGCLGGAVYGRFGGVFVSFMRVGWRAGGCGDSTVFGV